MRLAFHAMRVMVTGGRGTFGRLLVPRLEAAGHDVVITSRSAPAGARGAVRRLDLRHDVEPGLLDDVDAIVHAASDPARTRTVDVAGSARLLAAAGAAGIGHVLYLSIVGVDDHPFPYYRAKVAVEELLDRSPVPHTTWRVTQFHEFLARIFSTGPVVMWSRDVGFQVIDGDEVARRTVELVEAGPVGRAPDLGGPETLSMEHLARTWRAATGTRRPVVRVPAPGAIGRAFREGRHHTANRAEGTRTWDEWLVSTYGGPKVP